MSKSKNLAELVATISTHKGSWKNAELAQDIKMSLWEEYDPNDDLIYPVIADWDDLLELTIDKATYSSLSRDEVLSILFGLIHRNRVVEGLWWSMFERGVTQKLLARLLTL
jgi:hypothetical protein